MLGINLSPTQFFDRVGEEFRKIDPSQVAALADAVYECYPERRMVFGIGHGGTGSRAPHLCRALGRVRPAWVGEDGVRGCGT